MVNAPLATTMYRAAARRRVALASLQPILLIGAPYRGDHQSGVGLQPRKPSSVHGRQQIVCAPIGTGPNHGIDSLRVLSEQAFQIEMLFSIES